MLTKQDMKKLEEKFATKKDLEDLDKRVDKRFARFEKYLDYRLEPFEEMRKDFYNFKDQVLTSLDWLVAAFQKFNDEHDILSENYSRANTRLDNHEKRLKLLETS